MITKREFLMAKYMPEFKNYEVNQNSRGTIQIKVAEYGTNYYNRSNNDFGIAYQIGYNEDRGEYWIRRRNGRYTTRLHHNRRTGEYGFETFEDALEYLRKLFIKYKYA